MSYNDPSMNPTAGTDVPVGLMNPSASTNFGDRNISNRRMSSDDKEKQKERMIRHLSDGGSVGKDEDIEDTHIAPLDDDEMGSLGTGNKVGEGVGGMLGTAGSSISGAAKMAYGMMTGDEGTKLQGQEQLKQA